MVFHLFKCRVINYNHDNNSVVFNAKKDSSAPCKVEEPNLSYYSLLATYTCSSASDGDPIGVVCIAAGLYCKQSFS